MPAPGLNVRLIVARRPSRSAPQLTPPEQAAPRPPHREASAHRRSLVQVRLRGTAGAAMHQRRPPWCRSHEVSTSWSCPQSRSPGQVQARTASGCRRVGWTLSCLGHHSRRYDAASVNRSTMKQAMTCSGIWRNSAAPPAMPHQR